jgi:flagellar hook assembly protein FlgD
MTDTTAAAALASSMRAATTQITQAAHRAVQPENAVGKGVNVSSSNIDGSSSSVQFDATGQIIPSGSSHKPESATASAVNLFA